MLSTRSSSTHQLLGVYCLANHGANLILLAYPFAFSGKSAVLNSLIGHLALPTGEGGATRAPICIELKRDGNLSSKSIVMQIDRKSQPMSASALRHSLQDRLSKVSSKSRDDIFLKLKTSLVMGLLLLAILHFTHTELHLGKSELALSRFSSCVMLITYGAYFFLLLEMEQNMQVPSFTIFAGYLFRSRDWLLNTNIYVCYSICVVVGWIMGRPLDLNFQLFETTTLIMTVLVVAFMLQDGTSNYFKGVILVFCYLIVAASSLYI
ncbi:unnamed protein product [Lactuca saligna]|uniref:Uncharacterized protein n=1 Tax=Lactuca saligna TaxID=75948 RepID=A0AA35YZ26_LACSI|nr:unnamed protein product [Lactuca saligna]